MKWLWIVIILLIAGGLYLTQEDELPQTRTTQEIPFTPEPLEPSTIDSDEPEPHSPPTVSKANTQTNKPAPADAPSLGKDFVPMDNQGNRYITQIQLIGKHLVYHGDVLLGKSEDLPKFQAQKSIKLGPPKKWPQGRVPFVIDESLPNFDRVLEAIDIMNNLTNIQLVARDTEANYLNFTFGESDCYSYAGMIGGEQEIFLTPRCGTREILHELMHSIGFFHEQNREDRDQFIEVLWGNIDPVHHTQFKKIPNQFIGLEGHPFDLQSIMMYSSYTFSQNQNSPVLLTVDGDIVPVSRELLSDEDIKRVNRAYPK